MSIDPGFTGTGYAIWKRETFDKLEPPIASGSIVVRTDKLWWIDASHAADTLISLCQRYCVYNVYAELPKFMETAGAGLSAARDGDLVKLTTLFGIIAGRLCDNRVRIFTPVPVQEWKGNMPKDICNQRILGRFNGTWKPVTKTTHEVDAVGIGLYVKGLF